MSKKICWNCKHFIASSSSIEDGFCKLFKILSHVTGDVKYVKAEEARDNSSLCGNEAKNFKKRKDNYKLIYD